MIEILQNFFNYGFIPLLLFSALVFFHELGHFLVAKRCGVYVEKFSIGFGPAIFKKQWGETEYAFCLIPLGGYVKMHGEEMEAIQGDVEKKLDKDDPRSYMGQPVWNRIAIAAMGPIFNLILPIVVYSVMFFVGTQALKPVVQGITAQGPAAQAGLKPGDEITAINGEKITSWNHLINSVRTMSAGTVSIDYLRDGQVQQAQVTAQKGAVKNAYGEDTQATQIGVSASPSLPIIGITRHDSLAYQSGLRTGDLIVSINDQPVKYFWQISHNFLNFGEQPIKDSKIKITYKRLPSSTSIENLASIEMQKLDSISTFVTIPNNIKNLYLSSTLSKTATDNSQNILQKFGIESGDQYLRFVLKDSPAEKAGIQVGDKIISINDQAINSWQEVSSIIAKSTESLNIGLLRQGAKVAVTLNAKEETQTDELTQNKSKRKQIGIMTASMMGAPAVFKQSFRNPFKAFAKGLQETWNITKLTARGLKQLFTGKSSTDSLGGIFSIFYMSGKSYEKAGFTGFFNLMGILSISLALLNLLPVPMLDGGHLLFFFIEAITGRPVPEKIVNIGHQIGFVLIISLMLFTLYIDANRLSGVAWNALKSLVGA